MAAGVDLTTREFDKIQITRSRYEDLVISEKLKDDYEDLITIRAKTNRGISPEEIKLLYDARINFDDLTIVSNLEKLIVCKEIIANVENEVKATQVDYEEALYRVKDYLESGDGYYITLSEFEKNDCED